MTDRRTFIGMLAGGLLASPYAAVFAAAHVDFSGSEFSAMRTTHLGKASDGDCGN